MHKCYVCKRDLSAAEFYKDKTRGSGLSSKCKNCTRERNRFKRTTPEGKAKRVIESRRWKRANKQKEQAHKAVLRAIKGGSLIRPEQCSNCGSTKTIEGHHYDYSKQLEVVWVCQICHQNIHKELRNATR